jgi:hypothetical protein
MVSDVSDFIASLGSPVRGFPPLLRQTYSELLTDFETDVSTQGYDQINTIDGFEDSTLRGVAHRMYWWFPTHFFKFQDALLRWEQQCRESHQVLLLDRPEVTFVDLGCGAGAASAAVLATLEQYQTFCKACNVRVDPIRVNLIALDAVQTELNAYTRLIDTYSSRIERHKIIVNFQTICQPFPEGTPQILVELSQLRGHVLIIGMSNLINWIWREWDTDKEARDLATAGKVQPTEIAALQQLATQADFDAFHVIGIATKGRQRSLAEKLSGFLAKLAAMFGLAHRPFGRRWSVHAKVLFENPEGSRWVQQQPQGTSRYFVENLVNIAPHYIEDKKLQEVLSIESLEAAWAKVRSYMRYESLVDEVELKLFENDLDMSFGRIRASCLERLYHFLNVDSALPYQFPKNENTTRPRSLPRFEDQIIAVAVGINFAGELKGPCPDVSYSHRLAPFESEFLYQYWFDLYRIYLTGVLGRLDERTVCTTDIKSYYVCIRQSGLLAILHERLQASVRCQELLATTIARDCQNSHPAGYGLLQGHAVSGLLANVMLQPVDHRLLNHSGMRGRYSRFADDITVTGATDPVSDANEIQRELFELDRELKLNTQKTFHMDQHTYKSKLRGFRELETVGARFRALLLPLFVINGAYRREFHSSGWQFIYEYQKLLDSIGINLSPEWLYRKLDEFDRLWRRAKAFRRKWRPEWPAYSLTASASGQIEWRQQFEGQNSAWISERLALKRELSFLLTGAAQRLIAGGLTEERLIRQKRVLKFSLYRLSIFGVEAAVAEIEQLAVSQPWNIPTGLACQALARIQQGDALIRIFERSESSYVRAMALRALGKVRTDKSISFLASALDNEAEPAERLMASEGLLDANLWQKVSLDRIVTWLEREVDNPYIQKNIVLILGQAYPGETHVLQEMDNNSLHPIVHQAIHYTLTKPSAENLLRKAEPEVLRKYRAKSYPTIEELLGDEGSYALVS